MWENSLKKVESDNNNSLYEKLLDFLQRNPTYFLNKPRTYLAGNYSCLITKSVPSIPCHSTELVSDLP